MLVSYAVSEGIGDLIFREGLETIGIEKRGNANYKNTNFPSIFMAVKLLDDVEYGDLLFVDVFTNTTSKERLNETNLIGFATRKAKAGYILQLLMKGLAYSSTAEGEAGKDVFFDGAKLTKSEAAETVIGAKFVSEKIVLINNV